MQWFPLHLNDGNAYIPYQPRWIMGTVTFARRPVGAASAMDLATLSYVYGALLGFFHGARIAESEGFRVDHYGSLIAEISPSFGEFFKHEGAVIQSGNYSVRKSVEDLGRSHGTAGASSASRRDQRRISDVRLRVLQAGRVRRLRKRGTRRPPSSCSVGALTETCRETTNLSPWRRAYGLRARTRLS